ncbi:MAG: hypothetical protein AAGA30_06535 [Planctomycetota bacterium]
MKFPRFTLSQLLAWTLVVAATIALARYSESHETIWKLEPLGYVSPRVPDCFSDNDRSAPMFIWGTLCPAIRYDDGYHLYHSCHRRGWEHCRRSFYESREWSRSDLKAPETLSNDSWTVDHCSVAFVDGYLECRDQIEKLLTRYSQAQLRSKVGYSKGWHTIPLGVVAFIGLFSVALLQPSAKNGN